MLVTNLCCREFMASLPENFVDAIVTDPPYGLSKQPNMREVLRHWLAGDDYKATGGGFMGKSWDSFVPGPKTWEQAFRVLKPGACAAVFAGSRTVDLMATSLRLAGFEVVDMLHWLYGSGFPKSLDVSKAIDSALGAEREILSSATDRRGDGTTYGLGHSGNLASKDPITAAAAWQGWGTALKPCHEPIILARKPLDGTYANNLMTHGCGALNIDGCRVPKEPGDRSSYGVNGDEPSAAGNGFTSGHRERVAYEPSELGRWPGNVVHDGCLPEPMDRYFYCAKASKADRNAGLSGPELSGGEATGRADGSAGTQSPRAGAGRTGGNRNPHPTVKPTELMRWLCRLVTPPAGLILDPFTGSGSTGRGAVLEGFGFVGSELDPEYCAVANARIYDAILTATNNKG